MKMRYDKDWVEQWDKIKISEKLFDALDFVFHIIYHVIRYHFIGLLAVVCGCVAGYYSIYVAKLTGIWLILTFLNVGFMVSYCISYSIRRNVC